MPLAVARLLGAGLLSAAEVNTARVAAGMTATELKIAYALRQAEALSEDADEVPETQTIPVMSSAISAISWRNDGVIGVQFKRGGYYTYDGTHELFLAFASAPSKGAFFNANFK